MASRGTRYVYQTTWGSAVPTTRNGFGSQQNVANWMEVTEPGFCVGLRYHRFSDDDGEHIGQLRIEANNNPLGVCTFPKKSAAGVVDDGWQHAYFKPRIPLSVGTKYYVSVFFSRRRYALTGGALSAGSITVGSIIVGVDSTAHWNGAFSGSVATLDTHAAGTRYGVDMLFLPSSVL